MNILEKGERRKERKKDLNKKGKCYIVL
uniref:Uncharacterized protein n=1 Tax=Rhizophora mucronata TaxID=61149 RepID=A0A2P2NBG3_RHIMU